MFQSSLLKNAMDLFVFKNISSDKIRIQIKLLVDI